MSVSELSPIIRVYFSSKPCSALIISNPSLEGFPTIIGSYPEAYCIFNLF